jgi:hypothetical protein
MTLIANLVSRVLRLSPLYFAAAFYVGGVFGLLCQELVLRGVLGRTGFLNEAATFTLFLLVVAAPVWAMLKSLWLISRRKQLAVGVSALLLCLPFVFLLWGSVLRSGAMRQIQQQPIQVDP